jgi:hypothetical protein
MSIQELPTSAKPFLTRLQFAYEYKVPYSIVMDRVRRGELALHFVDNKVQVSVEEALKACERKLPGPQKSAAGDIATSDLFA